MLQRKLLRLEDRGSRSENSIESAMPTPVDLAQDRGAILVLLALISAVIVAMIALSIDTARLAASKNQQKTTSELAALAGLEAYHITPWDSMVSDAQNHHIRMQEAIVRAETISGLGSNNLLGNEGGHQVHAGSGHLTDYSLGTGDAGVLVPGMQIFSEPDVGCGAYTGPNVGGSCPCPGGVWEGSCFREMFPGDIEPNAMEVRLNTRNENPIEYAFAGIMNYFSGSLGSKGRAASTGRAALVPKILLFALDMSRSLTFTSHPPYEDQPDTVAAKSLAREYVYELDAGTTCAEGANPCIADGSACNFIGGNAATCRWYGLGGVALCPGMQANRPLGLQGSATANLGYRDDYECVHSDTDGDSIDEHYLIDTRIYNIDADDDGIFAPGVGGDYVRRGPEPLSTFLEVINATLTMMDDNGPSEDKIFLMAFDQSVNEVSTSPSIGRVVGPIHQYSSEFQKLKDEITFVDFVEAPATDPRLLARLKAGYFPRPGAHTDLAEAVWRGRELIELESLGDFVEKNFVLIGDGMNTCTHVYPNLELDVNGNPALTVEDCSTQVPGIPFDHTDPDAVAAANPLFPARGLHAFHQHEDGIAVATALVDTLSERYMNHTDQMISNMAAWNVPSFVDLGIAVHWIVAGDNIQPHTLLRKDSVNDRCMTDEQGRSQGIAYVTYQPDYSKHHKQNRWCFGTNVDAMNCPYYTHQGFLYHNMVVPTGGYWIPVRKPCDPALLRDGDGITPGISALGAGFDQTQCSNGVFRDYLDNRCRAAGDYDPVAFENGMVMDPQLMDLGITSGSLTWSTDHPSHREFVRLLCDPMCESERLQVLNFMEELYNRNPYMLVDDSRK